MPRSPGRTGHRWRQVRSAVLAAASHCAECGLPLRPDAPPRSRWSSSVDHIVKLEHGGAPLDPRNLQAVHLGCNTAKENRQRARPRRTRHTW